jgi:hypothetical protein
VPTTRSSRRDLHGKRGEEDREERGEKKRHSYCVLHANTNIAFFIFFLSFLFFLSFSLFYIL